MKYPSNINDLAELPIDFIGMIFYPKSPRFVEDLTLEDLSVLPPYVKRIGVFVNVELEQILDKANQYKLDLIQLHGNESPEFCKQLNNVIPVIKAFSISDMFDFEQTRLYEGLCHYFLFDTKTPNYGGSGKKFDCSILESYKGNTDFFLSGGISEKDVIEIRKIKHPKFQGLDLNSRFETEPGIKDISLLKKFINELKNEQD